MISTVAFLMSVSWHSLLIVSIVIYRDMFNYFYYIVSPIIVFLSTNFVFRIQGVVTKTTPSPEELLIAPLFMFQK